MEWKSYFEMLIDWKKLPAYKAEPRIDSLVGYFLKPILEEFLEDEIVGVIPEFPIRLGTVRPELNEKHYANRSYKVDFFAVSKSGVNYLVEFKTDTNSRRDEQDKYLLLSKELGTEPIVNGVLQLSQASTYTKKYNHLKEKLSNLGLLNEQELYTGLNEGLEIIYVQPSNYQNEKLVVDFNWIADWLERIPNSSEYEKELAFALRKWSLD